MFGHTDAAGKGVPPADSMVFLGVTMDIIAKLLSLSHEKCIAYCECISALIDGRQDKTFFLNKNKRIRLRKFLVFVWFWHFHKPFNRLRNFAVGIWRHEYVHGGGEIENIMLRFMIVVRMICYVILRLTLQLTVISLCDCLTPHFLWALCRSTKKCNTLT